MITSKQRAYLRGLANTIPALYQVGKGGIDQTLIKTLDEALEAKELIKVHVLENSGENTKELCNFIAERLNAEPVQAIGSKFVLYRESENKKQIVLK